MREAARELLARQHAETGEPMVCEDPITYAAVARLLRSPDDSDAARVKGRAAARNSRRDLNSGDEGPDQIATPRDASALPRLEDALPGPQGSYRAGTTAPRHLGLKGRKGRSVLLLNRNKLRAR